MLDDLAVLCERTGKLIGQARCRVNGVQPDGATRLVSLHEPDARPISKGRLGKPVEFGYKARTLSCVRCAALRCPDDEAGSERRVQCLPSHEVGGAGLDAAAVAGRARSST